MRTTIGQLLVNEALPVDLQNPARILDKKGILDLLQEIAVKYPDKYSDIAKRLMDIGWRVAHESGSSFSLRDFMPAKIKKNVIGKLNREIQDIVDDDSLSPEERNTKIVEAAGEVLNKLPQAVHAEGLADGNNLSLFVASGARGKESNINQLRGAPLLVTDHKDRLIPMPILNNYSEGLDPAEVWATSYGVRSGFLALKQSTPEAGYLGKQLANAAHKLIVNSNKPMEGTGLPVDTDDSDNEGAVLAADYGEHKAGTILTPKILKTIARANKRILIHSPMADVSAANGISQWAAGVRETGDLPVIGANIGLPAAQAISEPLSQSMISSKHTAGQVGASTAQLGGFKLINTLANIPKHYSGKAAVAERDGRISRIEESPQGGWFVYINQLTHYVNPDTPLAVKEGDAVEAGDALSEGIPSPADVVKWKGIGEGRRYFMERFRKALQDNGVQVHRRNVEVLSRALINHVKISGNEGIGSALPGDVMEYSEMAAGYAPRKDAKTLSLPMAKNKYLEQPVLHYSIGTRITPRVTGVMKEFGVDKVLAHDEPPGFEPEMTRAIDTLSRDPDWMTQLAGFNLEKNLLGTVHRGGTSTTKGPSYIPRLAEGVSL